MKPWREQNSDLGRHLETLHYLALGIGARQVIELGVRDGCSTRALLAAVEITGGRVWSCDTADNGATLADIRLHPQWTFLVGDDIEAAPLAPEVCDLLFIDTSHMADHTAAELATYGPRVTGGGVIVLHDADPHPEWDVIGPAWRYAHATGKTLTYMPGDWGLAVIR